MRGGIGEAVNVLVALTVLICTFISVCIDIDVLNEILYEILDFCAVAILVVILVVLVLRSENKHTFLQYLRRELYHGFVRMQVTCKIRKWLLEWRLSEADRKPQMVRNFLGAERIFSDLKKAKKMPGGNGEAVNVLVALTVICAFIFVCIDIDVVNEILYEILDFCAGSIVVVILVVLVLRSENVQTFLQHLRRELYHGFVMMQVQINSGMREMLGHRPRNSCHTIREATTSGFMIQNLKHDVVKRISDGVYQVNVETIGDVVIKVAPQADSESRESHDLAIACSNEFVLKSLLYYFNPNLSQVCYAMEHYDQNFKQWLHENALFDRPGRNLNPEFLQILRDVLRGIDYLHHVKRRRHGNLSVLNIVIVNGRAKITGMVNAVPETNIDYCRDYSELAAIVRRCFGTKQQTIPTELRLLLSYISTPKPSGRLLNIENHPIFLSPLQRLCYRVIAHTFLYFGNQKKSFALALNKSEDLREHKWKHEVVKFRMVLNCHKSLPIIKQRKSCQYNESATSFMRFGRNVVAHLKDNFNRNVGSEKMSAKEVEEELNGYWPEFMPILHQVLVEHGHLMVVHDAVLK